MALNTSWVAPGTGNTAGYLFDRAKRAIEAMTAALRIAQVPWEDRFRLMSGIDEELRRKVTRLKIVDATEELTAYDIERISAAIWDYDNGK